MKSFSLQNSKTIILLGFWVAALKERKDTNLQYLPNKSLDFFLFSEQSNPSSNMVYCAFLLN